MFTVKTQHLITVTVHGNAFTFDRYFSPQAKVPVRKPSRYGKSQVDTCAESRLLVLSRRVRRSKSKIIQAFCSLHPRCQPTLFISLTFPYRKQKFKNTKAYLNKFKRFIRLLKYHYPDCWFIYKVEWAPKAYLHYHLIGNLLSPGQHNSNILHKKNLLKLWEQVLDCQYSKGVSVVYYSKHISYITTPNKGKLKADIRCADILGKSRMHGYINKPKIRFVRQHALKLTQQQFEAFSSYIDNHLTLYSTSISHRKQLSRTRGRVSFVSCSVIADALKHARTQG